MKIDTILSQVHVRGVLGCWVWIGYMHKAERYPRAGSGVEGTRALHRIVYESLIGSIPDGLTIDHMCENRRCLNPGHLRPLGGWENTLLSSNPVALNVAKTACPQGHTYDMVDVEGTRTCSICRVAANRRWRKRQRDRKSNTSAPTSG